MKLRGGIAEEEGWKLRIGTEETGALLDSGLIHSCGAAAFHGWLSRSQSPVYYRGWADVVLELIFEIPA